jgi:uncharacterized membrane protein YccF (DUF307 family)
MRLLGNVIWFVFGGLITALEYFAASLVLMATIVGIPFGIQTFKIGILALWPFGSDIVDRRTSGGLLNLIMNILWIIFGGIWISLSHLVFALIFAITIIGIPFAIQHLKLARLALTPFGKQIL